MNNKMDLTRAEAVMDVITAQSGQALNSALRQLQGQLFRRIRKLLDDLLAAQAGIEAAIDYPEELEADINTALPQQLSEALLQIQSLISEGRAGRIIKDGIHIVLCGRPNVGKSSLLNALCGEDKAIVTPIPGTTRDVLDAQIIFDGVALRFFDTAGIRQEAGEIEQIGINRARDLFARADIILLLLDGSLPLTEEDIGIIQETEQATRLIIGTKSDLPRELEYDCELFVSANKTYPAAKAEQAALLRRVLGLCLPNRTDESCISNERHIRALEDAETALLSAISANALEEIATDLKETLHSLARITGDDVEEDIIEQIFARFCVGK
jgi:tRNA modification GTPase